MGGELVGFECGNWEGVAGAGDVVEGFDSFSGGETAGDFEGLEFTHAVDEEVCFGVEEDGFAD